MNTKSTTTSAPNYNPLNNSKIHEDIKEDSVEESKPTIPKDNSLNNSELHEDIKDDNMQENKKNIHHHFGPERQLFE